MSDGQSSRKIFPFRMMQRFTGLLSVLLLFLTVAVSCDNKPRVDMSQVNPSIPGTSGDGVKTLRIAVSAMISPEVTRQYYEDLLRVLAKRMGREPVFIQRRTYAEVNNLVRKGEVDLAFVCSGPYTQGHDEFGMEIIAVPVVHGAKVYHSYIIANRDSRFSGIADLKGHKFAFTDPDSNTGCLVPTYMLAKRGRTPATFFSETFFSNSHDNSIKAVAERLTDGAAVDSLIWEFFNTVDPSLTSRTKIIEKSEPYGIPPIVVHPALDPALKQELKKTFLSLHQDENAAPFLSKLQIERFEEGNDAMYKSVREMRNWVAKNRGN